MRWQALFDDLEAQAEAAAAAELAAEVADRVRRETGQLRLADRLRAVVGAEVAVQLPGLGLLRGRLLDAGQDWLLVEEPGGRECLVPAAAVLSVAGLGRAVEPEAGEVARRLDLRWALRGLARARAGVQVVLLDGSVVAGTVDRVGADHVDVAEHAAGEVRRAGAVRQVRAVPLLSVSAVRSG